jgi:hypothetical protein
MNIFYNIIILNKIKTFKNMCGRLYQSLPLARLLKIAKSNSVINPELHTSSFNVCPATFIPAIKPSRLYLDEH